MSDENRAIFEALDLFFENPSDQRSINTQNASHYIKRWNSAFVIGGFDWITWRLEKEGYEQTHNPVIMNMPDSIANQMLYNIVRINLKALSDIVSMWGHEAGQLLSTIVAVNPVEDSQSLIALMLANEYLDTFNPMQKEITKIYLTSMYAGIIGTSAQLSFAWTLYNFGEIRYWETLVNSDIIWKRDFISTIEEIVAKTKPTLSVKEQKSLVYKILATPENTDYAQYRINSEGIKEIIALDIASQGRAFRDPAWKRKVNEFSFLVVH